MFSHAWDKNKSSLTLRSTQVRKLGHLLIGLRKLASTMSMLFCSEDHPAIISPSSLWTGTGWIVLTVAGRVENKILLRVMGMWLGLGHGSISPPLSSILFLPAFSLPHPWTESLITEYPAMTNKYVPGMTTLQCHLYFQVIKTFKINAILQYKLCTAIKILVTLYYSLTLLEIYQR